MTEQVETAAIACELCRAKKQKCDRKKPVCTQCAKAPDACNYLEQHKRGLPAGYVNSLEKRLADTERALYFALAEIYTGTVQLNDYSVSRVGGDTRATQSQSKIATTQEWLQCPLRNRNDAKEWYMQRQNLQRLDPARIHTSDAHPQLDSPSSSPSLMRQTWNPTSTIVVQDNGNLSTPSRLTGFPESEPTNGNSFSPNSGSILAGYPRSNLYTAVPNMTSETVEYSGNTTSGSPANRARTMAQEKKSMYF
ncbi:hypothetical protein BX600DRAFT_467449 [Xylariales sp. PMI_506]|nr:hypothetical protein BX600DRAFT_467449 [Xylariales sp. PMI_506]